MQTQNPDHFGSVLPSLRVWSELREPDLLRWTDRICMKLNLSNVFPNSDPLRHIHHVLHCSPAADVHADIHLVHFRFVRKHLLYFLYTVLVISNILHRNSFAVVNNLEHPNNRKKLPIQTNCIEPRDDSVFEGWKNGFYVFRSTEVEQFTEAGWREKSWSLLISSTSEVLMCVFLCIAGLWKHVHCKFVVLIGWTIHFVAFMLFCKLCVQGDLEKQTELLMALPCWNKD